MKTYGLSVENRTLPLVWMTLWLGKNPWLFAVQVSRTRSSALIAEIQGFPGSSKQEKNPMFCVDGILRIQSFGEWRKPYEAPNKKSMAKLQCIWSLQISRFVEMQNSTFQRDFMGSSGISSRFQFPVFGRLHGPTVDVAAQQLGSLAQATSRTTTFSTTLDEMTMKWFSWNEMTISLNLRSNSKQGTEG